jgi:hypothetical protein
MITNSEEPHPVSIWVQNNVRDVYAARAPVQPSLWEVMWRLREGSWFKNMMATETPPSSVDMSDPAVHNAIVALSALLRAIDEHGPYRIPFDLDRLAVLRRVIDGDVDPIAIYDWLYTFCLPVVCLCNTFCIIVQNGCPLMHFF